VNIISHCVCVCVCVCVCTCWLPDKLSGSITQEQRDLPMGKRWRLSWQQEGSQYLFVQVTLFLTVYNPKIFCCVQIGAKAEFLNKSAQKRSAIKSILVTQKNK